MQGRRQVLPLLQDIADIVVATFFKLRALNILCLCANMDIIRHTCNVSKGKQTVLLTLSVNHNFANFVTFFFGLVLG